jgi:hypothetical protein
MSRVRRVRAEVEMQRRLAPDRGADCPVRHAPDEPVYGLPIGFNITGLWSEDCFVRWIAVTLIAIALLPSARAQSPGDEDQRLVCPVIGEQLARSIVAQIKGRGRCTAACHGCGCKGGPGYRMPDGRCAGYANLIRECGPPPHALCRRECAPVAPGCIGQVAGRAWLPGFAAALGLAVTFAPAEDTAPDQGAGRQPPPLR